MPLVSSYVQEIPGTPDFTRCPVVFRLWMTDTAAPLPPSIGLDLLLQAMGKRGEQPLHCADIQLIGPESTSNPRRER